MRLSARAGLAVVGAAGVIVVSAGVATAADASAVTYAFTASGSTVSNTITNNSGAPLTCTTSVAPAPGGVLPPPGELGGQSLYESGELAPGTTAQTVTDIPDGTYVALATCIRAGDDPGLWVSDYPGIEEILALFPSPSFAIEQASPIVTVPATAAVPPARAFPDRGSIFSSGSAN